MPGHQLVIEAEGRPSVHVRLDGLRTSIGSDPSCDVMIPASGVPPLAGWLVPDGGTWVLRAGDQIVHHADGPWKLGPYRLRVAPFSGANTGGTRLLPNDGPGDRLPALELFAVGRRTTLRAGQTLSFGQDPSNDWVLEDAFASGFHCRVLRKGDVWFVDDLGSTNGTRLNGLRVNSAELPARGRLILGQTEVDFRIRRPLESDRVFGMVGKGPAMQDLFHSLPRMAASSEPVLVTAETGCGKELVAQALHAESGRTGPFLALNCGAFSSQLIESELFGHVKGAFTGALTDKKGAFEAATDGTLFLDEVGELPLELQPKLLRVLESWTVRPVGGLTEIPVRPRIVAATHQNLEERVAEGQFREDLFHRLFVLSLSIPPLRKRKEDILPLAYTFLEAQEEGPRSFSAEAERQMLEHDWPGNVRELRNVVIRALFACHGHHIQAEHLRFAGDTFGSRRSKHPDDERARMLDALTRSGGNRSEAARLLGVSKSTFFDRLKRYGLHESI
ncbi:MAG: sigma-54 interaction domain-containing protein [Myxococcota bacterium]